jgi:ABC-type glycerol-3-phosphate transport system permease component
MQAVIPLVFVLSWNNFIYPLILAGNEATRTRPIPVAILVDGTVDRIRRARVPANIYQGFRRSV